MTSKLAVAVLGTMLWVGRELPAQVTTYPNRNYNKTSTTGGASFVGTIAAVNTSNTTLEVTGRDSIVRITTYEINYNTHNTRINRNLVNERQTTRKLEATGEEKTRKFVVGGFCTIEKDDAEEGRMGQRMTLADLKVGQRISVEYIKGAGDQYTAKSIVPVSALKLDEDPDKPKKQAKKTKENKNNN